MRSPAGILSVAVALACNLTAWSPCHKDAAPPIQSSGYTIIDLGLGQSMVLGEGANATLQAANGAVYPFPSTSGYPATGDTSWTQTFPIVNAAPVGAPTTYGNPNFAFSILAGAYTNASGMTWAVEEWGFVDHQYQNAVYVAQHNADGTWSNPIPMWQGPGGDVMGPNGPRPWVQAFNNAGLFLGSMGGASTPQAGGSWNMTANMQDGAATVLYNLKTGVLSNFQFLSTLSATGATLLLSASSYFSNPQPVNLDDLGRILLSVQESDGTHDLLLVPDGVSASPQSVPEPGAFLVFSLAVAATVWRRRTADPA